MNKSVVIDLGNGDLSSGFPRVTAQIWTAGYPHPEQFIGSLPPAPSLIDLYRNWQLIYNNLCSRKQLLSLPAVDEDDDELEIDAAGITNVSQLSFDEVCQQLQTGINTLLKSPDFINIELQLRSALNPSEDIQVIIETNDRLLRRLPWHRWDFFKNYPQSEMALSVPEYKRATPHSSKVGKKQVRILAILGNSQGINLETETVLFENLDDAEIVFLVNPSRQEFNDRLWDSSGWDILFFAGHSQTEGETGRIYINENKTNNSLTIEQLEEALKQAIENGLTLAFFNSCDGLGLALSLEKLNIPTVIVMREPVPNRVAQVFFEYFLDAFAQQRLPLHLAVQQARRKLQGLEDEFPAASWLPVICQNPAWETPTWLQLGGIPPCPYRGLFAFLEEDSHLFFGREKFTKDLAAAVKTKPLVAVVGPSGSGKSSVVFAGLIPALRQTKIQRQIISFRPGNNPFKALATALVPLLESNLDDVALLRGKPLVDAEYWQKQRRQLTISGLSAGLGLALILAGVAWRQSQNSAISEIKAISASAETLLTSNQALDSLLESLKASNKLNKISGSLAFYKFQEKAAIEQQVDSLLQEAVYKVTERHRLKSHKAAVMSVSFSPQGNTIATASTDKTVKLWNLNGREIQTIKGHHALVNSVVFSPDGQTIATASEDKTVKIWSLNGKEIQTLIGHKAAVSSVNFSPDGQTIATASWDGSVKLWTRKGKEIATFRGHEAKVLSVKFSPDGHQLVSSDEAGKLIVWNLDLTPHDLRVRGCDWVRDYLQNNPNVLESDRHLCDGIGQQKQR